MMRNRFIIPLIAFLALASVLFIAVKRAPDKHFQTTGVGLEDVARALSEWFRGERAFIAEHTWERLSL